MNTLVMSKSKGWPTGKPQHSGYQLHNRKKMACEPPHPAWGCWSKRTTFPQSTSKEPGIIEWCGMKKWWTGPGPLEACCPFQKTPRDAQWSNTRAPQMSCPLLDMGDLLDLDMLDMVRKDLVTPATAERASSLRPKVEELIGVPTPSESTTLEPEEATQPEEFTLVLMRRPLAPPGFTLSWADESGSSP